MIPALGYKRYGAMVALLLAAMPVPLLAQACSGSTTFGGGGQCDTTYRDAKITCDMANGTVGTQPPCPKAPMPMKITGAAPQSLIRSFTPYLFAFARDPGDATRPYVGDWARGTVGDATQTFQLVGNAAKDTQTGDTVTRQDTCVNQIDMTGLSAVDQAKAVRLQIDNCTNQYILHSALAPEYRKNPTLLSGEDPNDPSARISLKTSCQPLYTQYTGTPEYDVSDYLKIAWQKTMTNPAARKEPAPVAALQTMQQAIQSLTKLAGPLAGLLNNVLKFFHLSFPSLSLHANNEPHLPSGVVLKNTGDPGVAMPANFPDVTLAQVASSQESSGSNYEVILDPTHPFSPRWDFFYNDRDLSPLTSGYESNTKNSVYCAGNRADTGDAKKDQNYPVDVLEFRRPDFEKGMVANRIGFNTATFLDPDVPLEVPMFLPPYVGVPTPEFLTMLAGSYCYEITVPPIPTTPVEPGFSGLAARVPGWQCFGNAPGVKADDKTTTPPCATRYDGTDKKILPIYFPGGLNAGQFQAHCTLLPADSVPSAAALCQTLRAPFVPINVLKMRYHNPADAQNDELPQGVPEGYAFNDYFKPKGEANGHMPYPRLWDTGQSIQKNPSAIQSPTDVLGQYTAIVGVGREAVAKAKQGSAGAGTGAGNTPSPGERCMYGGWGGDVSFGGVSISAPDPVTSWTELKLYQARTTREQGLICLGRYEKAFKPRSSEGQLLVSGAGEYNGVRMCSQDSSGVTTCRDYADSTTPPAAGETASYVHHLWPLAWRGYLSDPTASQKFPAFGGNASKGVHTGLDDVRCGDLILMPQGAGGSAAPGLPKLARVVGVNTPNHKSCNFKNDTSNNPSNCMAQKNCYVDVEEADAGKWPDACGTTEVAGGLQKRRLFKTGHFPQPGIAALNGLTPPWTHGCEDPGLAACELATWNTLHYYRPLEDVRSGK